MRDPYSFTRTTPSGTTATRQHRGTHTGAGLAGGCLPQPDRECRPNAVGQPARDRTLVSARPAARFFSLFLLGRPPQRLPFVRRPPGVLPRRNAYPCPLPLVWSAPGGRGLLLGRCRLRSVSPSAGPDSHPAAAALRSLARVDTPKSRSQRLLNCGREERPLGWSPAPRPLKLPSGRRSSERKWGPQGRSRPALHGSCPGGEAWATAHNRPATEPDPVRLDATAR